MKRIIRMSCITVLCLLNAYVGYSGLYFGMTSAVEDKVNQLVYAQEQQYQPTGYHKVFVKQIGTSVDDEASGVAIDSLGDVYITGYTMGGLDGNTNVGGKDIFLMKYDSSGNKQWTKQIGTTGNDISYGIAIDSSDNIYMTGYTEGDLDGNISSGTVDIFLMKYDSSGNKQWTKQFGTSGYDESFSISIDSLGYIYLTGETEGGFDGNTHSGGWDIFVIKIDSSGNKQWTKQIGTTKNDIGRKITADSFGNIFVTGSTDGGIDSNINTAGSDIVLVKYNSLGNKQWVKQWGTDDTCYGTVVISDNLGGAYLSGFKSIVMSEHPYIIDSNFLLKHIDVYGNEIWSREYDTGFLWYDAKLVNSYLFTAAYPHLGRYDLLGNYQEIDYLERAFAGIAIDTFENIFIAGYSEGILEGTANAGGKDIFLIKYSK